MSTDAMTEEATGMEHNQGLGLDEAVEALLFSADRPTPISQIIGTAEQVLGETIEDERVMGSIESLNSTYAESGRMFRIEEVSGGFRVMTLPRAAGVIGAWRESRAARRVTPAALETLSIIAYRQPVTRAELESIRGVGCGEVLRTLLDRRLIKVTGRAEELGRPMLYGTTPSFLSVFGLARIQDLPSPEEWGIGPGAADGGSARL